jgi:hypothetical protein
MSQIQLQASSPKFTPNFFGACFNISQVVECNRAWPIEKNKIVKKRAGFQYQMMIMLNKHYNRKTRKLAKMNHGN